MRWPNIIGMNAISLHTPGGQHHRNNCGQDAGNGWSACAGIYIIKRNHPANYTIANRLTFCIDAEEVQQLY